MAAVRGPVTPVDVKNSAMFGVRRNGTGLFASGSPKKFEKKKIELDIGRTYSEKNLIFSHQAFTRYCHFALPVVSSISNLK